MGTLVLTESGYKNIEEIKEGDIVIATNPETGETEIKEVKRTFENKTFELLHLTVNGEVITSTPGHKYYAPEKGWTSAIDLAEGDLLQLVNGEYVVVEAVQHEILETPVTIYNFEVEDFHTYYVGEQSVLVHNKRCKVSKRLEYLGRTPSKKSKTGRQVIERMGGEGLVRDGMDGVEFKSGDSWYPISEADMAHKTDAVSWWNSEGRNYGARSKEAREFMLNPDNYYLEHYSVNRSQGARLGETYKPPKQ